MRRPVVVLALLAVLLVPPLMVPRPVASAEPEVRFEIGSGTCDHAWVLIGTGYPSNTTVSVEIPQMSESVLVGKTTTDGTGSFRAVLPPTYPPQCHPGTLMGLSARAERDEASIQRIAVYEVASPWRLSTVSCDETGTTLRGANFPPGSAIELIHADAHFATHSFAILAEVQPDAAGAFEERVRSGCPDETTTILARHQDGWARLDSTVPSPAATGHGLTRTTDRGLPLALAVVGLAILGGGRLATRERRTTRGA